MTFAEKIRGLTIPQLRRLEEMLLKLGGLDTTTPGAEKGDPAAYAATLGPEYALDAVASTPHPEGVVRSSPTLEPQSPVISDTQLHRLVQRVAGKPKVGGRKPAAAKPDPIPGAIVVGGRREPIWVGGEFGTGPTGYGR